MLVLPYSLSFDSDLIYTSTNKFKFLPFFCLYAVTVTRTWTLLEFVWFLAADFTVSLKWVRREK